ncbi:MULTISPECIES: uroporphyrinogen-III C-methyltransferase [unclassified Shewanella]|uniref:uroporphyrinogen-III C-methyltransferase n=1 Tax=unclassified Shewanella TaxID=196818 RepID=UPI000C81DD58|nr:MULTISPECIES: uroporphyrinogen-III C-methyltransferase [unclassified Shewanella]MDO6638472.1 uroporphyrinogen-III C-methyltransferase [Shewanella sp. 5_MG-2023]MDO6677356.1 uroporphyrinogen-III C-methyltransferase [Shewanella sp. 4_MG-2023]MDO6774295.1 uroporphyrinogen-III C-methyltransferase [Shewanella sp. 3_MG-2023]PMG29286.1 uroporphyrinogen-III C-methyltransferase [Shewanella sp. 10N.286.52.C2]PMG42237.1 uroporphyrinogen-III C-methyltransferase [Shewanella sp. 10N.286.52.B9]
MSHTLNKLINFNSAAANNDLISGDVEIVGAGCGQLDLMTIKAARIVSQAEALVYDSLVSSDILSLVSADCQRHFVGKRCGQPSYKQDDINALLAKLATQGLKVVRLKGGDPHIFGRGAEESLYLAKLGIASRFTPGITAALGCASTTGIPLTYRGMARSVTLVTGTRITNDGLDQAPTHWKGLLEAQSTLVFYMGKEQAAAISAGLMSVKAEANLPVALVTNGGRPNQLITYANVSNMAKQATLIKDSGPTLIIIGEVVAVGQELAGLLSDIKAKPTDFVEVAYG